MRADDTQWSTQSSAAFSDIQVAVDDKGKVAAYQADHYMPTMQDDRLIGAVIAGCVERLNTDARPRNFADA